MHNVRLGARGALIGFGVFFVVFVVLLALKRQGMPDFFGLAWWAVLLGASGYLVVGGLMGRNRPDKKGPGGWGAVMPPGVHRWMQGDDDNVGR